MILRNKKSVGKVFAAIIFLGLFSFIGSGAVVHAQSLGNIVVNPIGTVAAAAGATIGSKAYQANSDVLTNVGPTVIGEIVLGVSYVIAAIAAIGIAMEAWLVSVMLNINTQIFQSPVITIGYSFTLAFANLGFVLGIIIIALATILRSESYGMKKILWKLVAAAILVNFSLVIIAPIVGVANNLSNYFVNCIAPANGGCSGTGSGLNSFTNFAQAMAGSFQPQNLFTGITQSSQNATNSANALQGAFGAVGSDISKYIVPIASLVFVCMSLGAIVITFGALVVMLFMRYLYISILAILMPFAWLMWVFPGLDSNWHKWWQSFIRWAFFPPIVLFFVYLGIQTASFMNSTSNQDLNFAQYSSNSNVIWGAIANLFTNIFSPVIQTLLNQFVLVGIIMGGLFAANALGITFADTAMKTATSVANSARGYIGKQTAKGARKGFQKAGGGGLAKKLREGDLPGLRKLTNIPGLKQVQGGLRRGASLAGRGLAEISTNEELVKEEAKNVPKNWEEAKGNLKSDMNTETQFANIALGVKEGKIKRDDMINGKRADEFLDDHELVERYGQGKLVADANKVWMSTTDSRNAGRAIAAGKTAYHKVLKDGGTTTEAIAARDKVAVVKATKDIKDEEGNVVIEKGKEEKASRVQLEAMKEFLQNMPKTDGAKIDSNSLFSPAATKSAEGLEPAQKAIRQIADYAPQIVPNMVKGMKGPTIESFSKKYNETLDAITKEYSEAGNKKKEEEYIEIKKIFNKNIRGSIFGSGTSESKKEDSSGAGGGGGGDKH